MANSPERSPVDVTPDLLRGWPLPGPGQDKEERGSVLVVGGARQTPGAVLLAGEAALRAGAGKLQIATVASLAADVAAAIPEGAVHGLPESSEGAIDISAAETILELASGSAAVLLGPGLLDLATAAALIAAVVPQLDTTTVLDALSLGFVTDHRHGVRHLSGRVVLTPNRDELAATLGIGRQAVDDDPRRRTVELAVSTGAVVSSGGPVSWVAGPEEGLWQVEAGGPGLGVSGSGDVRAGVVLGLCARGASPEQAAVWAAYLHGRAGDRLAAQVGGLGFLARELPGQIPRVLSELDR